MKRKSLIKLAVSAFVMVWGVLTFVFLAGEENPNDPVSDSIFVGAKILALCSFLVLVVFCKYTSKKGLL